MNGEPAPPLQRPPHIGDINTPGQTAVQRVIHTSDAFFRKFINVWLLLSTLLCTYTFLWEPNSRYAGIVCLACGLIAKVCLHFGYTTLVRWTFITPFFMLLLTAPWMINGIRTPLLTHSVLLLIFTGWMLGTRVMWCFAITLSTSVFALWYAESNDLWQMPQDLRGVDLYLITLQFSLILTAVVLSVLIRNYRVDIQREATLQQRFQHTMQFNALIIDASPVPIRVFGPQGHCMAVNQAYAQLLGQNREMLLAKNLHETAMESSGLTQECLQVLHTGRPAQREVQVTTTDGRTLWLKAHLTPFERDAQRHLLAHFIDLTEQHHATQELTQLAYHDSLTNLANRRLLWEHFQHAQQLCSRNRTWAAVLLLDLNRFKQINDEHGHEAGDLMLKEIAHRLKRTVRTSDVIARLGGDEFTLLVQDIGHTHAHAAHHVQLLCSKLHTALNAPYHLGHITHHVSASIGAALMDPTELCSLDTLLRHADTQMYAQKKTGLTANTTPMLI